jgi:hypothetical protein
VVSDKFQITNHYSILRPSWILDGNKNRTFWWGLSKHHFLSNNSVLFGSVVSNTDSSNAMHGWSYNGTLLFFGVDLISKMDRTPWEIYVKSLLWGKDLRIGVILLARIIYLHVTSIGSNVKQSSMVAVILDFRLT